MDMDGVWRFGKGVSACFALGVLTLACSGQPVSDEAVLSGSATYRERMALPAGAVFQAALVDVSRIDTAAEVLGEISMPAPPAPPIRFQIDYDPRRIDATHRYAVRASIRFQDRLLFTTDTSHAVLTHGAPATAELMLRRAAAAPSAAAPARDPSPLRGLYAYSADAGWFTECDSGRRLPVAQEGDNAALESAYLKSTHAANSALLATVEGRIEERVPMEGAARPTLVVDRFVSLTPGACGEPGSASLEDTYWKVVQIRGVPVVVRERQREPHLLLHPADHRVSGHGGCNSLVGRYQADADRITFAQMAGTMMACLEGMEQEQALHQALGTVARWRIDGQKLELLDDQGAVAVVLESRYLK